MFDDPQPPEPDQAGYEIFVRDQHIAHLESIIAAIPTVPRVLMESCHCCINGITQWSAVVDSSAVGCECPACSGSGKVPVKCGRCSGKGVCIAGDAVSSLGDTCHLCKGHGYATELVPRGPGDEAWCYKNGHAYRLTLTGFEMFDNPTGAGTILTFKLDAGQGVDDMSKLNIQPDDIYADKITAELLSPGN